MNSTPFVRQYGILNNKWGALLCQKEYQTTAIRYIISNEKYIGDSVWQKYFSTDTVKVNSAEKITVFLRGGVQVEQDMLSFR